MTLTSQPNDVFDGGVVNGEWKPRPRSTVIGGIEWLARMSDKARAKAGGTVGAYIYPCPADKRLLAALEMDADTFQRLALQARNDDDVVAAIRQASPTIRAGTFSFSRLPRPSADTPQGGHPARPA